MRRIGEKIQKARMAKGLTLEAVQDITKIRLRYLEAIESGDFSIIPGEVYIKGFLVNFANAVDLDGPAILGEYYQLKNEIEQPVDAPAETAPAKAGKAKKDSGPKLQRKPASSEPLAKSTATLVKPVMIIGLALTLVVLVGGVITLLNRPANERPAPVAATPMPSDEPEIVTEEPEEGITTNVADLRLKATGSVWIELKDQETNRGIETVTLKAGETREWKISRPLVLRIGNAGGLLVSLYGEEYKSLGTTGQVVSMTIAPKNP